MNAVASQILVGQDSTSLPNFLNKCISDGALKASQVSGKLASPDSDVPDLVKGIHALFSDHRQRPSKVVAMYKVPLL